MKIQYIEGTNLAYFNGYKFRKDKKTGYWLCTTLHKRLHRYVYEYFNGEIPAGYQIHHKDHNKDNNEIENLQLLTRKEHDKIHYEEMSKEEKERRRKNIKEKAQPKAIEWHKSVEGKEWHKKHYNNFKSKMHILQDFICLQCGKKFQSTQVRSKYCCNACKAKYYRQKKRGNNT